jgi:oligopeptide transport system substrate-binding protein
MKKALAIIMAAAMLVMVFAVGCSTVTTETTAAAATTAAATTAAATTAAAETTAAAPVVLSVWAATEPESIDPAKIAWSTEFTLVYHMFDGLMRWDATVPGSKPELGDAKEIVWDATKTKATVTLRDDIFWSDGQPVLAKDYEYAWKRHADANLASAYGSTMVDFFKGGTDAYNAVQKSIDDKTTIDLKATLDMMAVKATGDKTLEFELARPCPFFDYILAFGTMVPVREDIITANGDTWTNDPKTYISNGRYVMAERKPNEIIVCQKNDKYWDKDSNKIDIINFKLLADENVAYAAYQTDEVAFINAIPLGEMETALASPDYIQGGLLGTYYYDFNVTKKPLDNAMVRKALSLAIDREYIVTQVTKQNQIPAYAWVPEGIVDVNDKTFRENGVDFIERDLAKDIEQAKQLLTDAGFPGGKGLPKIELSYNSNNVGHKIIAEAVANTWKTELGVEVELVGVEGTVFNSFRQELKHMIARDGWICDWNDPTSMLDLLKSTSGNNHTGYNNPDYDALLDQAAQAPDAASRSKILHDAETMIMNDIPAAPIYYYTNNFMLKSYVSGACFSPLGNQFFWNCTITK